MSIEQGEDFIRFSNKFFSSDEADPSALLVEFGSFQDPSAHLNAGFVFTAEGDYSPVLSAKDARKLSRWLEKAADTLEGISPQKKQKKKKRHQYSDDDEENDDYVY